MATTVYLSNPALTINSVNLTDQATSAVLTYVYEQLETTAFGDTGRKFGGGATTLGITGNAECGLARQNVPSEGCCKR